MKTQTNKPARAPRETAAQKAALAKAREADIEMQTALAEVADAAEQEQARHRNMAATLNKYKDTYRPVVLASGTKSMNNGDGIATALELCDPKMTAALADAVKGEPVGTHAKKYENLNNGQIRMNSGNRIRAAYKKAISEGDVAEANRIRAILGMEAL